MGIPEFIANGGVGGAIFGKALGFGKEGVSAENTFGNSAAYKNVTGRANAQANDPALQAALSKVLNPETSSKYASEQVLSNPLFAGMFGQQGYQGKLLNEEGDLSRNGYGLTSQDHEAYGQASDNAARMFGQQGNAISSQLAAHGLAQGGSGAGAVAFSGLAGNQNEQLAADQRSIANDRMNMNLQRLNSVRGAITNTQAQAQSALNSQQDNNQRGVDNYDRTQQMALGAEEGNQNQMNNMFAQQQGTKTGTFGEMLGGALANKLGSAVSSNSLGKVGGSSGGASGASSAGNFAGADSASSAAMMA